jgi:hypothetical protein
LHFLLRCLFGFARHRLFGFPDPFLKGV